MNTDTKYVIKVKKGIINAKILLKKMKDVIYVLVKQNLNDL